MNRRFIVKRRTAGGWMVIDTFYGSVPYVLPSQADAKRKARELNHANTTRTFHDLTLSPRPEHWEQRRATPSHDHSQALTALAQKGQGQ